ncbi:MAG: Uma2 family endonuclease [Planctomycetes bacterium]|nr:Uma2 family endonuclease [Planctomycetota bacterium]
METKLRIDYIELEQEPIRVGQIVFNAEGIMSDTKSRVLLPHLEEGEDLEEEGLTPLQFREMREASLTLERYFDPAQEYVSFEDSVYYDRRDLRRAVRPDVMVVRGVPARNEPGYYPWRTGKAPDWVLEIASKTTASRDSEEKPLIYHALGVREHFLFDPEGAYHERVLAGFALAPEGYVPIPENERGRVPSLALGLELASQEYLLFGERRFRLRFYLPGEDDPLPLTEELLAEKDAALAEKDAVLAAKERDNQELRLLLKGERGTNSGDGLSGNPLASGSRFAAGPFRSGLAEASISDGATIRDSRYAGARNPWIT